MKQVISVLLALLLLCGCAAATTPTETTQPAEALPAVSTTVPVETTQPPETTVPPDPMDLLLERMTPEQKVGQLFIVAPEQLTGGSALTVMTDTFTEALARYPVGGVILFAQNIQNPEQLNALNQSLGSVDGIPLFIAVDEEGGLVARLAKNDSFGLRRYKNATAVGTSGNAEDALEMGRTIGTYLAQYGFNLDFAPVADVNTNPNNPVIGTRAFSSDPEVAAQMTAAFAQGLRENGVIATFKHFPGHGDTAQDSHSGLAVSYRTAAELETTEFLPFRSAGSEDMVMAGHIALPNITGDMTPATVSYEIITGILKEQLGFSGLVITDAMNMDAVTETYPDGEAAVAAFLAGCDMVLMPQNLPEAFEAVMAALEDGTLSQQWLDDTVRRILTFKELHGIL